ncbi:lipid A deacylase LpxR family protein [Vibrio sp. SCSIO 43132]|uniref:lipid A deacylase LpxR family protein n=1 Tax=Vibrio sp. SCSIO 43132 TaxID=2779363 RepID=UPI001CA8D0E9|nr:lipid A deacylase LpxR family protein [Vibrio sp. SCSIO 43132]UAB71566.1 lipid A deacylase LpxR family protein [Vibrio sp. SCSIO 43132]
MKTASLLFVSLALAPLFSHAKTLWSLTMDNDSMVTSDRDYSSGITLGFSTELESEPSYLSWFGKSSDRLYFGIDFGQKLWTPDDIESTTQKPNERPYAGLSYLDSHLASGDSNTYQNIHVLMGVMGRNAQADSAQTFVHDIIGSPKPRGWEHQIEESFVYQLGYSHQKLLSRSSGLLGETEISWTNRLELGNFRSELGSGVLFRWGDALGNSFGSIAIKYDNPAHRLRLDDGRSGWFLFSGLEARYRHNDVTITGQRPDEKYPVSVTHFQSTAILGGLAHYKDVGVSLTFSLKTPDFKEDQFDFHGTGSLSLFWLF